ncbi:MAG: PhnD/SsuA/transferrin family substrate-binding protein, partial [Nitrososphaerota archaeon]
GFFLTVGAQQQVGTLVPEKLVIGMVPSRPADLLKPNVEGMGMLILNYVQTHGFSQVKEVQAVIPASYTATVEALGSGQIHIGLMGPVSGDQARQRYGAIAIVATKRGESLRYRGQFMAHLFGDFSNLLDLVEAVKSGKKVKFAYGGSSTSTSGFLFPCKTLKDLGILPGDNGNFTTTRAAGGHLGAAKAVYRRDVDVGVGFEDVRLSLDSEEVKKELGWKPGDPEPSSRVIVIGYTDWVPNDFTVAIKELKPELRQTIKEAFVAIMKTDDGKKFAKGALDATDFVPVPEGFDLDRLLDTKVRPVVNEIEPNIAKCERQ